MDSLPPEDVVLMLREARIEGLLGHGDKQRELLEKTVKDHPGEIAPLLDLTEFYSSSLASAAEGAEAHAKLLALLKATGQTASMTLLRRIAIDPRTSEDDLVLLRDILLAKAASNRSDPEPLGLLGAIQQRLGQLEDARATLGALLEIRPNPDVRQRCVVLDAELGRWDDAVTLLRAQQGLTEDDPLLQTFLVLALASLDRVDELGPAVDALLREDRPFPQFALPDLIAAGFAIYDHGRAKEAESLFRRLQARGGESPVLSTIIASLFPRGGGEGAQGSAVEAWMQFDDPVALVNEGAARLSAGDAASALVILRRATTLLPGSDLAWFNLGLAAAKLERWPEAEASFDRSVSLNPANVKALVQRATARAQLTRFGDAEADAQLALKLQPGLRQAYYVLYLCEKAKGNGKKAEEYLRKQAGP